MKILSAIMGSGLVTLGLLGPSPFLSSDKAPVAKGALTTMTSQAAAAATSTCREKMRTANRHEETPFLDMDFAERRYVYGGRNVAPSTLFDTPPKLRQENDVRSGVKFGSGGLRQPIRLNRAVSQRLISGGEATVELDIVQTSVDMPQTIFDYVAAVGPSSYHISLDRRSARDKHDWLRSVLQMNVYNGSGTPKLVLKNGPATTDEIRNRIVTVRAIIKDDEYRLQDRSSGEVSRTIGLRVPRLDYLYLGGDRSGKQTFQGYIRAVRVYRKAVPTAMPAVRTGTYLTVGFHDFSLNGEDGTLCLGPAYRQRQQISFNVGPGDQWHGDLAGGRRYAERSELRQTSTMKKGVIYWNAFDFRVDNYARGSAKSDFVILAQYHAGNSSILSPWLALRLGNPKTEEKTARFVVTRGDEKGQLGPSSSANIPDFEDGRWYRVAIETKADPDNGFARIWIDGRLILDERGAIGYADAPGAGYFRFGIYRTSGTLGTTMVSFDNVTGTTTRDLSNRIREPK